MPPKRAAPTKDARPDARKKARSSNGSAVDSSASYTIPRNKRWSKGTSGSAELDADYKKATADPAKAYDFICMCRVPLEAEDSDATKQPQCDDGKKCVCGKPAAKYPAHPWKISFAGREKWEIQEVMCSLRDPDLFDMYTYNDHASYGALEVVQNLILDFDEAGDWREKWAVTEALALFMNTTGQMITQMDDGEAVDATFQLLGRLFLTMLARLEREDELDASTSSIPNLALIMGLFIDLAFDARRYGCLEDTDYVESLGPKKDKKKWTPNAYEDHVVAYAEKYSIKVKKCGLRGIAKTLKKCNGNVNLPLESANTGAKADPWAFAKALKAYKREYGDGKKIGGDRLDITSWSSEERSLMAVGSDDEDPLKDELDPLGYGRF